MVLNTEKKETPRFDFAFLDLNEMREEEEKRRENGKREGKTELALEIIANDLMRIAKRTIVVGGRVERRRGGKKHD